MAAIGANFIPVVGPFVSLGLNVAAGLIPQKDQTAPPALYDRRSISSQEGNPIPIVFGNKWLAGECIWMSQPSAVQTKDNQGQIIWSYRQSFAMSFGEGPAQILKLKFDGRLVFDATPTNYRGFWSSTPATPYESGDTVYDPLGVHYYICILAVPELFNTAPSTNQPYWEEIDANFDTATGLVQYKYSTIQFTNADGTPNISQTTEEGLTLYPGNESQTPDPVITSFKGFRTPGFRGLCYAVFENLVLHDFGDRIPNIQAFMAASPKEAFPFLTYTMPSGFVPARIELDVTNRAAFVVNDANNQLVRINPNTIQIEAQGTLDPRLFSQSTWTIPATTVENGALAVDSQGFLWAACQPSGSANKLLVKYGPLAFNANNNLPYIYTNYPQGLNCKVLPDGNSYLATMSVTADNRFRTVVVRTTDAVQVGTVVIGDVGITYGQSCRLPVFDDYGHLWFVLQQNATSNWQVWKVNILAGTDASGNFVAFTKYSFTAGPEGVGIGCVYNPASSTLIVPTSQGGFVVVDVIHGTIVGTFFTSGSPMWDSADYGSAFSAIEAVNGRLTDQFFRIPISTSAIFGYDVSTFTAIATFDLTQWLGAPGSWGGLQRYSIGDSGWAFDPVTNSFILDTAGVQTGVEQLLLGRAGGSAHSIKRMVSGICFRAGLPDDALDTSELTNQTAENYCVTRKMTAKQALSKLTEAYFFDIVESDGQLRVKLRQRNPVMIIPQEDLGLEKDKGPVEEQIGQEADLPLDIEVNYEDPALDYQPGKQSATRSLRATNSRNHMTIEWPLALSADKARRKAQNWLYLAWLERFPFTINLWKLSYLTLDGADVVLFGDRQLQARILGSTFGQDLVSKWSLASDNANQYVSGVLGTPSDPLPPTSVGFIPSSLLFLLDMPLLRDADNPSSGTVGFYLAVSSPTAGWPGAVIDQSLDNISYSLLDQTTSEAVFGYTVDALCAPDSPFRWDYENSFTVTMPNNGTMAPPASASELAVLNGANMVIVGQEVVQYQTRSQNNDGSWTFSNLLRGRRGTDWACGLHEASEPVFFVSDGGIEDEVVASSQLGQTRFYRAISIGQSLSTPPPGQSMTLTGAQLKPYSPCHVAGSRDMSNNLTITWVRRDRIGSGYVVGPVPLSEASELYDVEILSSLGAVLRTIAGLTSPTTTYSAANQTADFGSPQASVNVNVYQRSSAPSMPNTGRGYVATATV